MIYEYVLTKSAQQSIIRNHCFAGTVRVFYIRWGKNTCPVGETNVYSGHFVANGNDDGANGDYQCLPEANPPQTQNTDSDGKNIPCAACLATGRSTVFTFPGKTVCPTGWTTEYVGKDSKWSGRNKNLCVDTDYPNTLSQTTYIDLEMDIQDTADTDSNENQSNPCAICSI